MGCGRGDGLLKVLWLAVSHALGYGRPGDITSSLYESRQQLKTFEGGPQATPLWLPGGKCYNGKPDPSPQSRDRPSAKEGHLWGWKTGKKSKSDEPHPI